MSAIKLKIFSDVRPLRIPPRTCLAKKVFGIDLPSELAKRDVWLGYKSTFIRRHTYNARRETVAEKPSFRDAWRRAQHHPGAILL